MAQCWASLEAAHRLTFKAAWLYDAGKPCGAEAIAAKLLAADAGFAAKQRAMQTLGGMGHTQKYPTERYWRESKLYRIAPSRPSRS